MHLKELGFVNEVGENPPECVLNESLEPYLPNINDFSSVVLALTFDSGPPDNPTARSYVFYFFRGQIDPDRRPDDILTFKIKLDNPSNVHIVDKYLGGAAFGVENAPALAQRDLWRPGLMSKEGKEAFSKPIPQPKKDKSGSDDMLMRKVAKDLDILVKEFGKDEAGNNRVMIPASRDQAMDFIKEYSYESKGSFSCDDPALVEEARKLVQMRGKVWVIFNSEAGKYDLFTPRDSTMANKKSSGCFIATAAFGTPFAKEIAILSIFRDEVLQQSNLGRSFIKLYYRISPSLARLISSKAELRWLVRTILIRAIGCFSGLFRYAKKVK